MKVLVLGHSYVWDLRNLEVNSFTREGIDYNLKYLYKPGASYESLIRSLLSKMISHLLSFVDDLSSSSKMISLMKFLPTNPTTWW